MKIENNRALAAEKKTYEIPSVEMTQLAMSAIVMAGSGNIDLGGGGGGSLIPD